MSYLYPTLLTRNSKNSCIRSNTVRTVIISRHRENALCIHTPKRFIDRPQAKRQDRLKKFILSNTSCLYMRIPTNLVQSRVTRTTATVERMLTIAPSKLTFLTTTSSPHACPLPTATNSTRNLNTHC